MTGLKFSAGAPGSLGEKAAQPRLPATRNLQRELLDDAALDPDQIVAIDVVRGHRVTLLKLHFALHARAGIGAEPAFRLVGQ
jgi:hypothetical protein